MLDYEFLIFCTVYISMLCVIIITCIYIDFDTLIRWAANQGMENVLRNNNNLEDDLDQESFETPMVSVVLLAFQNILLNVLSVLDTFQTQKA